MVVSVALFWRIFPGIFDEYAIKLTEKEVLSKLSFPFHLLFTLFIEFFTIAFSKNRLRSSRLLAELVTWILQHWAYLVCKNDDRLTMFP